MPKYIVYVREIWVQGVEIEAANKGAAIAAVFDGYCNGEILEDSFEYSDTRDISEWTVDEIE